METDQTRVFGFEDGGMFFVTCWINNRPVIQFDIDHEKVTARYWSGVTLPVTLADALRYLESRFKYVPPLPIF